MGSIRYRSCSIEGTRADAILTFREAVAQAVAEVQDELVKLNDLTSQRRDESITLTGQNPSSLIKEPIRTPTDTLVVRSMPEGQGLTYRKEPKVEKQYTSPGPNGETITQGRGGLQETYEAATGHWLFQNVDGSASAATDDLIDSSFYGKNPKLVTGSAPSTSTAEGPLGYSRTFDGSAYFVLPTKVAISTISLSQMLVHNDLCAWAWVKPTSASERVVFSFSSPASPDPLNGTASLPGTTTVVEGRTVSQITVTSTAGLVKFDRIVFGAQPDRVYEVIGISGLVLTLSEQYSGTSNPASTMRTAFSKASGVVYQPETGNTLYALSVEQATSKVRFYWERDQRVVHEAVNTNVAWSLGDYLFVGFQRRNRNLGHVTKPASSLIVTGSGFTAKFGLGSGAGKFIRFVGDGVSVDDRFYEIDNVASDTQLTLKSTAVTLALPAYDGDISSHRIMIHVGKLDGTFNTQVFDHKPGPTGGVAPENITTRNIVANYYVGHDAEFPARNFIGSMNALSMYLAPIDTGESPDHDAKIRRMFSRSFPDYIAAGKSIQRSVLSDITDGQTVYCDYEYKSSLNTATITTDQVNAQLDDMLAGLDNPTVKTTSQLAQTIGTPDPALQYDIDHLNRLMPKWGMLTANGQPLVKGSTDMSAYNALAKTVGSTDAADKLIVGKPTKSFVLIALTEDYQEIASVDSCGRPSTTLLVTERIVGINKNLNAAAMAAGYSNTDALKLRFWWIGSVGVEDASIQKMRNMGMTGAQIADALAVTTTDKLKVYVIPVPDISVKLQSIGITTTDINEIATRPDDTTAGISAPTIIPINTSPDLGTVAATIQKAITAPGGVTVDGDQSPLNPALVTAQTVDLGKALYAKTDDIITDDILTAADKDCQALIAIIDDMLGNVSRILRRVTAVIVPFALRESASIGNQKLAFDKYIPCVANVSASFSARPFHIKIDSVVSLLKHLLEQATSVLNQSTVVVDRFNRLLCIPKTLIAAIRGGVCGIEQPKVVADRQCPPQLDLLLDRLQALVDTIELLLRKILQAITSFTVNVELTGGSASKLAVDASIPCIGPVANFLLVLN
jgi:hypothetical protein